MKKVLAMLVSVLLLVMMVPMGIVSVGAASYSYDPDAAIAYAKEHWDDGVGLCARFVSDCLKAGGFTAVYNVNAKALGRALQNVGMTITCSGWSSSTCLKAAMFNGKLSAGDVIIWENKNGSSSSGHAMLYSGKTNSKGQILVYAHNVAKYEEVIMPSSEATTVYAIHIPPSGSVTPVDYSKISTGNYFVKNNSTGRYLCVSEGKDVNKQNVAAGIYDASVAQTFEITPSTTTAGYMMRPLCSSSRVVNIYGNTVSSGNNVCLWDNTGHDSQRWNFEKVSGGYVIRNVQNANCVLTVESDFNVGVQTYTGADNQIWSLQNLVQYNANGGTGAPESQFKNYGETLKLSNTVPAKEGYTFKGWATSQSATTAEYAASANYTGNAAVTLYAVWQANTLAVSYHANGGTITLDGYMLNDDIVCKTDGTQYIQTWTYNNKKEKGLINRGTFGLSRSGYTFLGWGTDPNGGTVFHPDDVDLTPTDIKSDIKNGSCSIMLYAVWKCNHTYDNACDTTCNTCGEVREMSGHVYTVFVNDATCGADGVKTYTCSICSHSYTEVISATGNHAYDDEYDAACNVCGDVREVPEKPPVTPDLPADAPAFVVESAKAQAGKEVTVVIRTQRNSGIVSFKIDVAYDTAVLELIAAEEQDFVGVFFGPLTTAPFAINWVDAIHPDNTTDGVIALLTFRVKEGAPVGKTDITLSYDADNVFDQNYDSVAFRTEDGFVEVVDFTYGDVDGNGKINNRDLAMMQQYITGWSVAVDVNAADVDVNGKVNNRDLARLQQYITGWDVTLG